jgi:hypothetical protein
MLPVMDPAVSMIDPLRAGSRTPSPPNADVPNGTAPNPPITAAGGSVAVAVTDPVRAERVAETAPV